MRLVEGDGLGGGRVDEGVSGLAGCIEDAFPDTTKRVSSASGVPQRWLLRRRCGSRWYYHRGARQAQCMEAYGLPDQDLNPVGPGAFTLIIEILKEVH